MTATVGPIQPRRATRGRPAGPVTRHPLDPARSPGCAEQDVQRPVAAVGDRTHRRHPAGIADAAPSAVAASVAESVPLKAFGAQTTTGGPSRPVRGTRARPGLPPVAR